MAVQVIVNKSVITHLTAWSICAFENQPVAGLHAHEDTELPN
ncbi:MAG: hypothetical protein U5K35_17970 [Rhodohalobacter sp.]|nr:hypothetical protein [Rhodohalobacter sp.]